MMHRSEFEKLVAEGYERLPQWVREKIKNVALLIEDEPSAEIRKKERLSRNETLLGYYQGIPLSARGEHYGVGPTMPDTITLYQKPIEDAAAEDGKDVRDVVAETIWHEFAHHFGMDEHEVRHRERMRDGGIVLVIMAKLSEILRERGYVYQYSSEKLEEITDGPKRMLYLGIDPSADSLQVGQLQGFLILRRFLEDGHKLILVIGGGTGMIGDPGGKSSERVLLDAETVTRNAEKISEQVKRLFGSEDFTLVNNAEWLGKLKVIEFLRDVGKHFTVNAMLQRDFIKDRVKDPEKGISYTEFSYALLQAYDYLYLHKEYQCDLQVGGSDQWGNIISGVDFIRRKTGDVVYAFTWPLLVDKATGRKFGKSEAGTIWLDAAKTSPYQFYQFWINAEDKNLKEYLLKMTMLSKTEIEAALELHKRDPKERHAQQILAREVTNLVHGADEAGRAEKVSQVLFGETGIAGLSREESEMLRSAAPSQEVQVGMSIIEALIGTKLSSSKREARQFLADKAVSLNGKTIDDAQRKLASEDFHNGLALLRRGKKHVCALVLS